MTTLYGLSIKFAIAVIVVLMTASIFSSGCGSKSFEHRESAEHELKHERDQALERLDDEVK